MYHQSTVLLIRLLRRHRRLAEQRDPMFYTNKAAKWVVGVSMVLIVLYLVCFAILLATDANGSRRFTALEFAMGMSPFILTLDFWARFIAQQTPSQIIKPYVLLPIPRYICIDVFIFNSLFGWGNLFWFGLLLPYCLMSVVFSYGFFPTLSLLLLYYILILANSQWYSICRSLITRSLLWILLPLAVSVLVFLPWIVKGVHTFTRMYAHIGSGLEHGNIFPHFIAFLLLTALVAVNRRVQYANVWQEMGKQRETKLKHVSRFEFFNRFGETGEYLKMEIKSLLRNKNPRKSFIYATAVVVLLSVVVSTTDIYDTPGMTNFWCFYNFVIYGAMLLVRVMAYEGNYIDVLMVYKENILKLLTAKYYFFCGLLVLPFLLMLPMVIVGKWSIVMLVSFGMFTAGFQYFLLMQLAVYNKQKIPLNEKFISKNGIENSYIQIVLEGASFVIPMILISVFEMFFSDMQSWLFMMGIGVAFVLTHKIWLRNIYRRMMLRKYDHLEAFHH